MAFEDLRVVQVNTTDLVGGAARISSGLLDGLRQLGLDSYMAVGQKLSRDDNIVELRNGDLYHYWRRFLLSASYPISVMAERFPRIYPFGRFLNAVGDPNQLVYTWCGRDSFHYQSTRQIVQLFGEPDIVHLHNLHGYYFDLRALPWLCSKATVMLTLHDSWLMTGHCACPVDCERWRSGCGECHNLAAYPRTRRDATAFNWHRKKEIFERSQFHVSTPSKWLLDRVSTSMLTGGMSSSRVIPNGVDLERFKPGNKQKARASLGLPEEGVFVLLTLHNPYKDMETMESCLRRLRQPRGCPLVFIALGKRAAPRLVGDGLAFFPGYVSETAVIEYYQAADIRLHAAKYESFGLSITESMACGLPVVATSTGGIPEQVEHAKNGFLCPPGDAEAMASYVQRLIDDEYFRREVGSRATGSAQELFGVKNMVKSYLDFYHEAAEKHAAERQRLSVEAA